MKPGATQFMTYEMLTRKARSFLDSKSSGFFFNILKLLILNSNMNILNI